MTQTGRMEKNRGPFENFSEIFFAGRPFKKKILYQEIVVIQTIITLRRDSQNRPSFHSGMPDYARKKVARTAPLFLQVKSRLNRPVSRNT
jgi:hypothetical protein